MENNNIQTCEFCRVVFSNLDDLAYHLVYDHANDLSEENLAFKNNEVSNELQNYVNDPKVQRENTCDYCGKSFSLRAQLKTHIHTVHEG